MQVLVKVGIIELVRDDRVVGAKLAREEYLPLIASATARAQVGVARPKGAPGGHWA